MGKQFHFCLLSLCTDKGSSSGVQDAFLCCTVVCCLSLFSFHQGLSVLLKNIEAQAFFVPELGPCHVRYLLGKFHIQLVADSQLSQPAVVQRWMSVQLILSGCLPVV